MHGKTLNDVVFLITARFRNVLRALCSLDMSLIQSTRLSIIVFTVNLYLLPEKSKEF